MSPPPLRSIIEADKFLFGPASRWATSTEIGDAIWTDLRTVRRRLPACQEYVRASRGTQAFFS